MRTVTKCFVLGLLTVATLLSPVSARTASAQIWSAVASSCVVDTADVARASHNSGFGTVSFKGTKLGRIRLTCAISGLFGSADGPISDLGMSVSFYDPDGTGSACAVRASLLRTNLNAQERGSDIVGFDSNTGFSTTEPGTGRSAGHVAVPEAVNFGTSYYWVQLELVRSSTTCNPVAVGVHLVPIFF